MQEPLEVSVEKQLGFDGNYGNDGNDDVTHILGEQQPHPRLTV